jgi:hypothetical protein
MRPLFDIENLPEDTPIEWAQAVNIAVVKLGARKVTIIDYDEPTRIGFCCKWVSIFLQAHIRRGLSLLKSGAKEIKQSRPLAAALCSRALLEDSLTNSRLTSICTSVSAMLWPIAYRCTFRGTR